jgi:hypothetical protein
LTKNVLGHFLADFFTNSSGHPSCRQPCLSETLADFKRPVLLLGLGHRLHVRATFGLLGGWHGTGKSYEIPLFKKYWRRKLAKNAQIGENWQKSAIIGTNWHNMAKI